MYEDSIKEVIREEDNRFKNLCISASKAKGGNMFDDKLLAELSLDERRNQDGSLWFSAKEFKDGIDWRDHIAHYFFKKGFRKAESLLEDALKAELLKCYQYLKTGAPCSDSDFPLAVELSKKL